MFKFEVGFIGGGNMGTAIIERMLQSHVVAAEKFLVCDVDEKKLSVFSNMGCATTRDLADVITNCRTAFVAVKPQIFDGLKPQLCGKIRSEVVISIMAGKKVGYIKEAVGDSDCHMVRLMPNLACKFGEAVILADFSDVNAKQKAEVLKLLDPLGMIVETAEKDFNFCSAINGCGPAFFFEYFKAFYQSCLQYGMDKDLAKKMVLQTAKGSATLALNSQDSFETLISNVCSKGGSTIEGVKILEAANLDEIISKTVAASKNRNDELEKV